MDKLTAKIKTLIDRGYNKEEVLRLSYFSLEDIINVSNITFLKASNEVKKTNTPIAMFVGGQPGSGKSVFVSNIKTTIPNVFIISADNYRSYHPNYIEIEDCVEKHWIGRTETNNDSPGNDIADFTHDFSCIISDKLTENAMKKDEYGKSYNICMEWAMREPYEPMKTMKLLKSYDYNIKVFFICVHKDISLQACNLRSEIMKKTGTFIRKIPEDFHNFCVKSLPDSINVLYEEAYKNNLIDYIALSLRDGSIIWQNDETSNPGNIYQEYLNNPDLTKNFKNYESIAKINNLIELSGKDTLIV